MPGEATSIWHPHVLQSPPRYPVGDGTELRSAEFRVLRGAQERENPLCASVNVARIGLVVHPTWSPVRIEQAIAVECQAVAISILPPVIAGVMNVVMQGVEDETCMIVIMCDV